MPAEPRIKLPIKVFLQGTVGIAVTVLVIALSLLMVGYASRSTALLGAKLAEAEASATAQRVSEAFEHPMRAAIELADSVESLEEAAPLTCNGTVIPGLTCTASAMGEALLRTVSLAGWGTGATARVSITSGPRVGNLTVTVLGDTQIRICSSTGGSVWAGILDVATGAASRLSDTAFCTMPFSRAGRPIHLSGRTLSVALSVAQSTCLTYVAIPFAFGVVEVEAVFDASILQTTRSATTDLYPVDFSLYAPGIRQALLTLPDRRGIGDESVSASAAGLGVLSTVFSASAVVDTEAQFSQIQRALFLVIFVTIGIGVAVGAASTMLVLVLVRPVVRLSRDMTAIGRLDVDEVELRRSLISEIEVISRSIADLVEIVRELRRHMPAAGVGTDDEGGEEDDDGVADLDLQHTMQTFSTRVAITYESRKTARQIASANFDFLYTEADGNLFERLCTECKDACDEDEYERVSLMFINATGESVVLRHSMQLQELLAAAPARIELIMQKTSAPRYGIVATGTFDVVNAFTTIAYAVFLLQGGVDSNVSIPFICLYVFSLCMNLSLALVLLRRAAEDDKFDRWLERSSIETTICIVLCTANLQDMEVLWSGIKVKRRFRFNAPDHPELLQRAVAMSVFGFLFSDVAQLLFKTWLVYNGAEGGAFSYVALVTSGLSVLFNMLFKMHAMLLWQGGPNDGSQAQAEAQDDAGNLVWKDVSLVTAHFTLPTYIRQLQLQGLEVNEFYRAADETAKRFGGIMLTMQSGTVVVAFNVTRRTECHVENAVAFAVEFSQQSSNAGRPVTAAVTTRRMLVGMLGTINVKTMHCFGDFDMLNRLVAVGAAANCQALLCGSSLRRLAIDRAVGETAFAHVVNDEDLKDGVDLGVAFPKLLVDIVRRYNQDTSSADPAKTSHKSRNVGAEFLADVAVGVVECGGSQVGGDLRLAELMVATSSVAPEEATSAAQRMLTQFGTLRADAEQLAKQQNVFGLSTLQAVNILDVV